MSPRVAILPALLAALAALEGCGDARRSRTPSIDLLDRLGDADVTSPTLDRLRDRTLPPPASVRLDDSFDDGLSDDWFAEVAPTGADPEDGRSVAFVGARSGRLTRYVLPTVGAAHVVTARVRVLAEPGDGAERPGLFVRFLSRAPTRAELDGGAATELIEHAGSWRTARLEAGRGTGWHDLSIVLPADPTRGAIEVTLAGGDVGLLVDLVRVRRLGALEATAILDPSRPIGPELLRARIDVHQERRDALVVPGASRVAFEVDVPRRRPRLDTATTLVAGATGDATLRVRIDGEEIATRTESPVPPGRSRFEPWVVPLERFAGRRVRLTLEADGPPDVDTAWGTPRLLGTPESRPGPNLVLVSLDTLRADMVGAVDPPGGRTPHLDAFAADGTTFARALSLGAYTLPSHATMMTGQHPLEHGVEQAPDRLDARRSPLLAARLAARGWRTAAFTGGGFVDPRFGFDQGFSQYGTRDPGLTDDPRHVSKREEQILDVPVAESAKSLAPVLEHLGRVDDQPFFLFVHTYVVHNFYPHRESLETPEVRPELAGVPGDELYRRASVEFDPAATERLAWLYRSTVRQADDLFVGPLLRRLDQ
ncbi:MAG: sulfatase-like hydrolase/transferase, partial [Planctomycetota bacterium JB042]